MDYDQIQQYLKENHQYPIDEKSFCELYQLLGEDVYTLYFDEFRRVTAAYSPSLGKVVVSIPKLNDIIDYYMKLFQDFYQTPVDDLFRYEMLCYIILHEIEHMYQDAIGDGCTENVPYSFLEPAMGNLMNIFKKKSSPISFLNNLKKFLLYQKNANNYYLERGAIVEGSDRVAQILDEFDEERQKAFLNYRNQYLLLGYFSSPIGSLKETYYGLGMKKEYDSLPISPDIPLSDKVRYGLELNSEEYDAMKIAIQKKKKI